MSKKYLAGKIRAQKKSRAGKSLAGKSCAE